MTTARILNKLTKLKNMAEGAAAVGNEAEAQAFAAMFQRLMTEHKIEMSDLEFAKLEESDPVARYEIDYSKYRGTGYKETKVRVAWMERLASIIARAHFCRIILWSGSNRISLVGRKSDVQVAEWMIITLQRAAEKIATHAHSAYSWEVYKVDRNTSRARGFKGAFLQAFIMRLAERYENERNSQVGTSQSTALVRVRKEEAAVEDFMKKLADSKQTKKSTQLRRLAEHHGEGIRRGRAAADKINLTGKAVAGNETKGHLS